MIPAPNNALVSYHYLRSYDLDKLPNLRVIGDSGAFSALSQGVVIGNKELAEWGHKWKHRLAWVAALDVIGDADATRKNWVDLTRNYDLPGVPTMHFGSDPRTMDFYADQGVDFMGLGGMVGHKSSKAKLLRWLVQVFKYQQANHPEMRFHGWGVTAAELLRVPFFSVDSFGWLASCKYGRLTLRDPRTGERIGVMMNGKDAYEPATARMLSHHYGVAPSQVARSSGANKPLIIELSALSASVQEQRFRRMHGVVTEPKWGINQTGVNGDGPHLHLVMNQDQALIVGNMKGQKELVASRKLLSSAADETGV